MKHTSVLTLRCEEVYIDFPQGGHRPVRDLTTIQVTEETGEKCRISIFYDGRSSRSHQRQQVVHIVQRKPLKIIGHPTEDERTRDDSQMSPCRLLGSDVVDKCTCDAEPTFT